MFIDLHVHAVKTPAFPRPAGDSYATPEQLIAMYDAIGIDRGVILPEVSPEGTYAIQSIEEVLEICDKYPGRFTPFCNIDPRMLTNTAEAPLGDMLRYYMERGCRGVGEITANLRFDDPRVENLFHHCEEQGAPVIFHMAWSIGDCYGLYDDPGLPLLEGALRKFPKLVFLGHSQPFWAEIAALESPDARMGYPDGKVARHGRVVELMQQYPNLYGDLSAGSGFNAVSRDEEFGCWFLEKFSDRLCFATDICSPRNSVPLAPYLLRLRDEGKLTAQAFEKISHGNAERLLGL